MVLRVLAVVVGCLCVLTALYLVDYRLALGAAGVALAMFGLFAEVTDAPD